MSDSTPGTPAAETGAADQGPIDAPEPRLREEVTGQEEANSGAAGDTLGSGELTGNDGTAGADAVAGDAGLAEIDELTATQRTTPPEGMN